MPTLREESIYNIARRLLGAAGALDDHATTVARHLADANLAGHDSHGFIRIPQYVSEIREGKLDPKAHPEMVVESAGTAQVNGNGTFGQVVATWATRIAMKKAQECGISLVTMCNLTHTGRIGAYPEMAAKEGMAAIMFSGGVGAWRRGVAPFGGREGRLGTNPISMAFPHLPEEPLLLDFATAMAAEGKIRVARAKGELLPDTWVLDKDGIPSNDPEDLYEGGAILPVGGLQGGHKGYALSTMVAVFGGVLGELGCTDNRDGSKMAGSSIIVMDVGALAPIDGVQARVENMVQYLKDTPPMQGSSGVLYPGEIEARSRQERLANGVPVPQQTWDQVSQLIEEYGLREELGPLP